MPRHLTSDAHEWINEIPTVPIYYLAKPQPRERAWRSIFHLPRRGRILNLALIKKLTDKYCLCFTYDICHRAILQIYFLGGPSHKRPFS